MKTRPIDLYCQTVAWHPSVKLDSCAAPDTAQITAPFTGERKLQLAYNERIVRGRSRRHIFVSVLSEVSFSSGW